MLESDGSRLIHFLKTTGADCGFFVSTYTPLLLVVFLIFSVASENVVWCFVHCGVLLHPQSQ